MNAASPDRRADAMDPTLDILCLGEPLMELSEIATPEGPRYLPGFGGDTANAAVAAARQGARVGYLTALGADGFGDRFIELWRSEGIDARAVTRDPAAHTGVYFISHGPDGHRFSYLRAGSAASRLGPGNVPADLFAGLRVLHVSAISQAIGDAACDAVFHAIDLARRAGARVSYDTNYRARLWPLPRARAIIHAAVAASAVVFPSLDDSRLLTGLDDADAIADFYLGLGPALVVLKLGADGALVATPGARRRVPGAAVAAVDASGAGDAFAGSFLAEYLATGDPFAAARYANACAALSTTGYGAVAPIPHRAAVEAFLTRAGSGLES